MSLVRYFFGVLAAIPLVVGSALAPVEADRPSIPVPEALEFLSDSAAITGPAIAKGVLRTGATTAPKDSLVMLYAWPSGEDLARVKVGETVKTVPVAYARASADGTFELKLSEASETLLHNYRNSVGEVDFELIGTSPDAVYVHNFTAKTPRSTKRAATDRTKTSSVPSLTVQSVPGLKPRLDGGGRTLGGPFERVCETKKVADLGKYWVTVGYGYIDGSGAKMKFTYRAGASSTLGVAVSATGGAGTYRASGSSTFSSTSTVTYPATTGNKLWKTQFRYGKYKRGVCPYVRELYVSKVDGYAGGSRITTVKTTPVARHCVWNDPGTSFIKDTTAAYESSSGVSISGPLGVDLSSRTGYTSTAKITFSFSKMKRLCGTNADPGGNARRLVSR